MVPAPSDTFRDSKDPHQAELRFSHVCKLFRGLGYPHRDINRGVDCKEDDAEWRLRTEAGATIVHDEHGPIALPRGSYAVVPQREFDGLRWRQVLD